MEFIFLGPFEVRVDHEAVDTGGMRQRGLLAILALNRNEVVSTDRLIDQLWGGEPPSTALHTVQVFVSRLRKALAGGADRLVTRGPGYALEIDADAIDAARCERMYTSAERPSRPETIPARRACSATPWRYGRGFLSPISHTSRSPKPRSPASMS